MKFSHELTLLCTNYERCLMCVGGEAAAELDMARNHAMARAVKQGWYQLGDEFFCPRCSADRVVLNEAMELRAGKFCPLPGRQRKEDRREPVPHAELS